MRVNSVGSPTEKAILLVLANYANKYEISWPSQPTWAEQSACTDRTVRSIVQQLEACGVVRRVPRRRGNGSHQSDIILLTAFGGRTPAPPGLIEDDEGAPEACQSTSVNGVAPDAEIHREYNELTRRKLGELKGGLRFHFDAKTFHSKLLVEWYGARGRIPHHLL